MASLSEANGHHGLVVRATEASGVSGDRNDGRAVDRRPGDDHDVILPVRPRLPAAAAPALAAGVPRTATIATSDSDRPSRHVSSLYLLTLLSGIDGSLLLLAASGQLETLGGSVLIGLLVIAGAGSWLAAHRAFAGRSKTARDWLVLGALGVATAAATLASAWIGLALGQSITLHVLPKAMGIVLFLVAGEVAGLHVRVARIPAPMLAIAGAGLLEVALRWTP